MQHMPKLYVTSVTFDQQINARAKCMLTQPRLRNAVRIKTWDCPNGGTLFEPLGVNVGLTWKPVAANCVLILVWESIFEPFLFVDAVVKNCILFHTIAMRTYSCVQNLRISFCGWICPEKVFSARTQSSWSTYCQLTICHLQTLLGWYWNSVQMVKRLKLANFGLTIWGLVVLSDTCIRHHPIHASYQLFCESLREIDVNDGIVNVPEMPRLCCS